MEIAVLTRSVVTDRFTPAGRRLRRERLAEDICVTRTSWQIRRKWLEIAGELLAPWSRHPAREKFVHAPAIIAAWRPLWRDLWRAVDLGHMTLRDAWAELERDGTLHTALGLAQGVQPIAETWVWGRIEMCNFGLAYVPERPMVDVERIAAAATELTERRLADGTLVTRAVRRLDSAALGLPPSEMARITDTTIVRPVDYTMPIDDALIVPRP